MCNGIRMDLNFRDKICLNQSTNKVLYNTFKSLKQLRNIINPGSCL